MTTTRTSSMKSTIVRAHIAAMKAGFGLAEAVAPGAGGRFATRRWLTVPAPPRVGADPSGGESFAITVGSGQVRGTCFGSGPVVYLVHGWGGVAGQMSAFVDPLRDAGYRVVVFDAPSHGRSDPGSCGPGRSHGAEFAAALSAVAARFGPADAVVAHSLGALPSLIAHLDGLELRRLVLVAPVRDLDSHLVRFAAQVGMGRRTRQELDGRIARLTGWSVVDLDVHRLARTAAPVPLLVVHDRGDRETRHDDSVALAERWPGPATMISTDGLGHRRLLADPAVVAEVIDFVGDARARSLEVDGSADRPVARLG